MNNYMSLLNNFDADSLKKIASSSEPFPFFYIDNFLESEFAEEVYQSFPSYKDAITIGRSFNAINEVKKVQITDETLFPEAIQKLNLLLNSQDFLDKLSHIMGIPNIVVDPKHTGGGIHETNGGGRLDVHVDFNFNKELKLFRRINILIYFNKDWKREYGGILDLWDKDVTKCYAEIMPIFNRMACFATSEISYHGVTPLKCNDGITRKSFAGYYYTKEAPSNWDGTHHSTIFKPRPTEWMQGHIYMPISNLKAKSQSYVKKLKTTIKNIINR